MIAVADRFYAEMEAMVAAWAATQEDILAVFVVGSRARQVMPADAWSDLDILFFTDRQESYLSSTEWVSRFGDVWTCLVSHTAGGDPECLALFEGGWQVDFVIHATSTLRHIADRRMVPMNFHRGVSVLVDKENLAPLVMPDHFGIPPQPAVTSDSFSQNANRFWFGTYYVAKQILRGDDWVVKARDADLKGCLLEMMSWHEKAIHGMGYDTWHAGRFLREWASQDKQLALRELFATYDAKDSWRVLVQTAQFYRRLAIEVANRQGLGYPRDLDGRIMAWMRLQEDEACFLKTM